MNLFNENYYICVHFWRGSSDWLERRIHNPEVAGSDPALATHFLALILSNNKPLLFILKIGSKFI